MQKDQHQTGTEGDGQGAGQMGADLGRVARAMGLRHQTRGAHAQKAEHPVDRGQDHRADADRANGGGLPQLADHPGINRPQQGHGRI